LQSKIIRLRILRTIILAVVLCGCETWSFTLREDRRLRVFESRVMRRIYGPKRYGVTRNWRRVHIEELTDLYSAPNIILVLNSRIMRWAGHVARMVFRRGAYSVLVEKREGRDSLKT
jgi:hypothetical protein